MRKSWRAADVDRRDAMNDVSAQQMMFIFWVDPVWKQLLCHQPPLCPGPHRSHPVAKLITVTHPNPTQPQPQQMLIILSSPVTICIGWQYLVIFNLGVLIISAGNVITALNTSGTFHFTRRSYIMYLSCISLSHAPWPTTCTLFTLPQAGVRCMYLAVCGRNAGCSLCLV